MRTKYAVLLIAALLPGAVHSSAADRAEILILYDNTSRRQDLTPQWGFAALVTFRGRTVLFDSGTKPDILLANMKALKVDPATIQSAVISHHHTDHIGGIYQVYQLNRQIKVHFLDSFEKPAWERARAIGMTPVRVTGPVEVASGIHSTGEVPGKPPEQALIVRTAKGLAIVTGCSHPGVVSMVEAARRLDSGAPVRYLVGGFHMIQQDRQAVMGQIERLRALGVARISATHCTGEPAIAVFRETLGNGYEAGGAGKRIVLE